MDKVVVTPQEAVADIPDGATIAIAGFSLGHRFATSLILALRDQGTQDPCIVCNSLGEPVRAAFSARPGDVVTDLALLRWHESRFVLDEVAPDFTAPEVLGLAEMEIDAGSDVRTMD